MKYEIIFELTAHKTLVIEAEDEDQAYELAGEMDEAGQIVWEESDYKNGHIELMDVSPNDFN